LVDFFLNKDKTPFEKVTNNFERVLAIADKRQTDKHLEELINSTIRNTLGKYSNETLITNEMQNEILNELINKIMPFIGNLMMNNI